MALGVPVVATSAAARGLEARRDEHFLVEDDPARFAQAVIGLLRERDARCRLAERARAFVERHHSWPLLLARIEALVVDAAARRGSGSPAQPATNGLAGMELPRP
jgi:glycosyltransferase involved in cell wall biosynthesis